MFYWTKRKIKFDVPINLLHHFTDVTIFNSPICFSHLENNSIDIYRKTLFQFDSFTETSDVNFFDIV